jgi:hypothetical protein
MAGLYLLEELSDRVVPLGVVTGRAGAAFPRKTWVSDAVLTPNGKTPVRAGRQSGARLPSRPSSWTFAMPNFGLAGGYAAIGDSCWP